MQTEFQAAGADDAALQMLERVRAQPHPSAGNALLWVYGKHAAGGCMCSHGCAATGLCLRIAARDKLRVALRPRRRLHSRHRRSIRVTQRARAMVWFTSEAAWDAWERLLSEASDTRRNARVSPKSERSGQWAQEHPAECFKVRPLRLHQLSQGSVANPLTPSIEFAFARSSPETKHAFNRIRLSLTVPGARDSHLPHAGP